MNKTTLDQIFEVINHEGKLQPHASVATIGKLNAHATHIIDRALQGECDEGYELNNMIIHPSEMALMLSEFTDTSSNSLTELLDCPFCMANIYYDIEPFKQALERFNDMVAKKQARRHRVIDRIYKDVFNFYELSKQEESKYRKQLQQFLLDNKLYHLLTLDMLFTHGLVDEVKARMQSCKYFDRKLSMWNDHPEDDFNAQIFFTDKEINTELVEYFNTLNENWNVVSFSPKKERVTILCVIHNKVNVAYIRKTLSP